MPAVCFTRRFSMAHRLIADPQSKCATPHGHNEVVRVELSPRGRLALGGANMAAPFEVLKRRWHAFIDDAVDHAFQLNAADPLIDYFHAREPERLARVMTFPGDPTTEALAICLWLKLEAFLHAERLNFDVTALELEETPTNAVRLRPGMVDFAHCGVADRAWPRRADMTINDL